MIRVCLEHGYYDGREGDACPRCGNVGGEVLSRGRRVRLSKLMSGALRHFPGDLGLELDHEGWVEYDEFVAAVTGRRGWATRGHVAAVIATDPKERFERRVGGVRASYGHSIDVEIQDSSGDVPDELYHGTAPGNVDSIMEDGIQPMGRQMVHLSPSREEALEVGGRHTQESVVVVVDTEGLERDGYGVSKRGPTVFTVREVPPRHITRVEDV